MPTDTTCLPWWHTKFDDVAAFTISMAGCQVGPDGNVPCDPEAMRADAEAQMNAAGYDGTLSLDAYSLARYVQSEVGVHAIEETVAVAEAAINRGKLQGGSPSQVLLYRPGSGYGHYGPIHGIGTGTSTAPYGRWAATSQDPSLKALLIAKFVADGDSNNFSNNADDQDGPEAWIRQGQAALTGYVQNLARNNKYWVGPLPGIDPWHTFLQTTGSSNPQADMQAGIDALTLPRADPGWGNLTMCTRPLLADVPGFGTASLTTGEGILIGIASIAAMFGALKLSRWLAPTKSV